MVQDSKIRPARLNHLMFAIIHELQYSLELKLVHPSE